MKTQLTKTIVPILLSVLVLSCNKTSIQNSTDLKQALTTSTANLNSALNSITRTPGYSILTMNSSGVAKSATADYQVNIPLDKIKGVYEYNKPTKQNNWGISLIHFFTKTAESNEMIVKLPLKKLKNPMSLRHYSPADSSLVNNFSIAVSDYHNNYNSYWDYDYLLSSQISINDTLAGNLDIKSTVSPTNGINYNSQYAFKGGYTAKYWYLTGDTTHSGFAILSGSKVLYQEELLTIKNDTARFGREHEYILTIGNIQIIRKGHDATPQVKVNGVLQAGAKVTIIDKENDPEASVCKERDIQITFEDGTTAKVSSLISSSVNDIKTIYSSLHKVYFAAYVVDWIAYDIYYQR